MFYLKNDFMHVLLFKITLNSKSLKVYSIHQTLYILGKYMKLLWKKQRLIRNRKGFKSFIVLMNVKSKAGVTSLQFVKHERECW